MLPKFRWASPRIGNRHQLGGNRRFIQRDEYPDRVLPVFSWVKSQLAAEEEDAGAVVFEGAKTAHTAFVGLHFAIESFGDCAHPVQEIGGDLTFPPGANIARPTQRPNGGAPPAAAALRHSEGGGRHPPSPVAAFPKRCSCSALSCARGFFSLISMPFACWRPKATSCPSRRNWPPITRLHCPPFKRSTMDGVDSCSSPRS